MASILPKEETIIDPLYEPLKLNRYELCPHLTMLSNVSHLRYGFSPYLLFDVVGWKEVVGVIGNEKEIEEIEEKYKNFLEKLGEYLDELEKLPCVDNTERNVRYEKLKDRPDAIAIKGKYKDIKTSYQKTLDEFFGVGYVVIGWIENVEILKFDYDICIPKFKENFGKIAHLFRLDYPVKVKCPERDEKQVTEQFMCEEGKIYSMKEALLRTFELRRAKWLQMSGSLHTVHRASTHTRLSHEIGSMIAGVNALREIDVYPVGDMSMSLGEYLLMRGELHEFLMANFLHDIGHSPLSHVMEPNPFIKLDHEEITRNLILGKAVKGEGEEGVDWYVAERYLLKMKTIKDFEHRFFENRYDPIYNVGKEEWDEETRRNNFLACLGNNDKMLESEIVTVNEVLENFGVDTGRVIEILSGKMFCPKCGRLLEIEDNIVKCEECNKVVEIERQKIYDTQFLNKLIESEVDLDRMDHVKRDSVVCGLSLISFRLLELLGSMSVVLPDSDAYEEIHNMENNKPCILISEDGLLYVMDLLTARKSVFKDVLYSDENNWINGVVNQITALAVRYLPHLTNMLPFITDQVLMHFYTNDLFLGTQIDRLNKLFHGKMGSSGYGTVMRYKLKDGVIITKDDLKKMYKTIEGVNDYYDKIEIPVVVFYTNIKPMKCPNCRKKISGEPKMLLLCPSCMKELKEGICKNKNCDRETIKLEEAIKVFECEECKAFSIIIDPSENLETLLELECPFYDETKSKFCGGNMKKQKRNLIQCKKCNKKICKLVDERWDDIFVYAKKYGIAGEQKYFKFEDLAGKHKNTLRERFPERPSELDVKNLFYVWVSDFVITNEDNKTNGHRTKEEWVDDIKEKIGEVWTGENESRNLKMGEFDNRFVDLDKVMGVVKHGW